ncbi:hypothetical protein BpHYR1_014831 [Brachionus plicatilis]|uniref:Uncharacterized protein n=1 Tax=Brachionus plicatilis TaxID=10195 RepID=A0A3M7QJ40_BRAPC|nr:hypothetical protein BpHYR1_014831 [Brachionus plicatilis]
MIFVTFFSKFYFCYFKKSAIVVQNVLTWDKNKNLKSSDKGYPFDFQRTQLLILSSFAVNLMNIRNKFNFSSMNGSNTNIYWHFERGKNNTLKIYITFKLVQIKIDFLVLLFIYFIDNKEKKENRLILKIRLEYKR